MEPALRGVGGASWSEEGGWKEGKKLVRQEQRAGGRRLYSEICSQGCWRGQWAAGWHLGLKARARLNWIATVVGVSEGFPLPR